MEKKLNCISTLSLREMALRKIAVVLVSKPEFSAAATEKFLLETVRCYQRGWLETLYREIKDNVSRLPLPASLTLEMRPILKAVAAEVIKWKLFHKSYLSNLYGELGAHIVEKLSWTSAGTIDYRKTSETFVNSDEANAMQRFELACLYCLEDCIPALWNELPEMDKTAFCDERDPLQVDTPNLQLFLPYIIKKYHEQSAWALISFRDNCFKYAAWFGNATATEYCFETLPREGREALLYQTAVDVVQRGDLPTPELQSTSERRPDVLCYLLSLMTAEEQLRLFKERPCQVLASFLFWPWQDLFLDIADIVWTFLPEDRYENLLSRIKSHIFSTGNYIPNFFREFFLRSPRKFRKFFLDAEWRNVFFFSEFLHEEDFTTVQVIFENIDAVDKRRLLFSWTFLDLFGNFLMRGRYLIVEECIRLAKLSKKDRVCLKEVFAYLFPHFLRMTNDWATDKRKRFLDFLDEMDASTTGEKFSQVNKLCSERGNHSLDGMDRSTAGKRTAEAEMPAQVKKSSNDIFGFRDAMHARNALRGKPQTVPLNLTVVKKSD